MSNNLETGISDEEILALAKKLSPHMKLTHCEDDKHLVYVGLINVDGLKGFLEVHLGPYLEVNRYVSLELGPIKNMYYDPDLMGKLHKMLVTGTNGENGSQIPAVMQRLREFIQGATLPKD